LIPLLLANPQTTPLILIFTVEIEALTRLPMVASAPCPREEEQIQLVKEVRTDQITGAGCLRCENSWKRLL
jgi:hypothetical protein